MSRPTPHPHFDDRGTLDWHTDWRSALHAAQAEEKLVLVELGRELCGQCRTLVQSVIPHPEVAPLLQEGFVALAADADDTEDEVIALAEKLEDAEMLPFVLVADAQGRFLAGHSGSILPRQLAELLRQARA
jgi:thioredoxin-related protein